MNSKRNDSLWWALVLIVVVLQVVIVSSVKLPSFFTASATSTKTTQLMKKDIENFIKLRSNKPKQHAIWYHRGILRNPSTGNEIAGIEGVEMCKAMPSAFTKAILHDHLPHLSNSTTTSTHKTYLGGSYLTKKFFTYVDIANRSQEINTFRIQRQSPQRSVQPTAPMYELITLYYHPDQDKIASIIEWPSGRKLFGHKVSFAKVSKSGKSSALLRVDHVVSGKKKTSFNKWISFASTSEQTRGRSHESFLMEEESPSKWRGMQSMAKLVKSSFNQKTKEDDVIQDYEVKMSYRRFGEGPYWYFPGKPCLVEVDSYRLSSWKQVPKHAMALVDRLDPTFRSQGSCSLDEFENSKDQLDDFKPWYRRIPFLSK